jgi:DNA replication licensing factor MCM7
MSIATAPLIFTIHRHYIARARRRRPTVPPEISNYIVDSYVRLRKIGKDEEQQGKSHSYTSARTLLAVLRLSQALARLRFSNEVDDNDVDEALRLMEVSKASLQDDNEKDFEPDRSATSQIFRLIKGMAGKGSRRSKRRKLGKGPDRQRDMDVESDDDDEMDSSEVALIDIRARVLQAGFTEAQLNETIVQVSSQLCLFLIRRPYLSPVRGD